MNRRDFLKLGSTAIAAAALPVSLTANTPEPQLLNALESNAALFQPSAGVDTIGGYLGFDPHMQYGNEIRLFSKPTPEVESKVLGHLWEDMCRHVPPSHRDKISVIGPTTTDYGRATSVAWKYDPR